MSTLPLLAGLLLAASPADVSAPIDVRVGIVAYEDFRDEYAQFETIFRNLSERDPQFHFQLAVGSYGHVLHWLDRQQIDVAVLTPGVFAGLLSEHGTLTQCQYLATVQLPPANSPWAEPARRDTTVHGNFYQSVCLVAADSPLQSVADLRARAEQGELEFLFVHPLSVSGRAAPEQALREAGIAVADVPVRFTYSHSQSIRLLTDPTAACQRVAFVWDDAAGQDPQLAQGVRAIPFPELAQIPIPHDVVVARRELPAAARLQQLLLEPPSQPQRFRFVDLPQWQTRYQQVRNWLQQSGSLVTSEQGERIALDEIGHLLLQYTRSHDTPPRLALVLSGGGAKCSYQIGAVAAIEEKLRQLRRENPQYPLDIELVVGTSGGAINSLPIALGISATKEGQQALTETWTELNQCEIIRPPLLVRINMGLWFALLQTAIVIGLVKWRVKDQSRQGWVFAASYTALAGAEVIMGYAAPPPWSLLGTNHVLHHAWLWFSFGVKASAWFLLAIGVAALVLETIRARRHQHIQLPRGFKRATLATGLLGLPLLQLITIAAWEETLSVGDGMESALAIGFPRLINRYLEDQQLPPLQTKPSETASARLRDASSQIMERGLLKRDLVITGSCLDQTSQELPPDLYFYAARDAQSAVPPYAMRGVSLHDHPQILLDVVMGSGSIYPLFPARRIPGIPRQGQQIELVDGGFAHNSPVEAAVMWGATHILLVDVMARGRMRRGNFLQNATSSVRHLHRQAQLLDARSRDRVTIFTLSPEPPHICIIDFASNLVRQSIQQGYDDASIEATQATPRFEKEIGQPAFQPVLLR